MAAINAQQIRKIYAIGNALGIVERGNEDDMPCLTFYIPYRR